MREAFMSRASSLSIPSQRLHGLDLDHAPKALALPPKHQRAKEPMHSMRGRRSPVRTVGWANVVMLVHSVRGNDRRGPRKHTPHLGRPAAGLLGSRSRAAPIRSAERRLLNR
jgi:hypothetical protein